MMVNTCPAMNRRGLIGLFAGVALPLLAVSAHDPGKGQGKSPARGRAANSRKSPMPVFTTADRDTIFLYVRENEGFIPPAARQLPPGLAKNLRRGKPLPPGWVKKIVPFPVELERRLPPLPAGYRRVVADRWAFVIAEATNSVLDVIDLIKHP
jgi:hypothetical protein